MSAPPARVSPRPRKPAPRPFFIVAGIVAVAMTVWSAVQIDFTLMPLLEGNPRAAGIIEQYLNPNWAFVLQVWPQWLETLLMAVIASFAGAVLGLVFALMGSHRSNRSAWFLRAVRALLSVLRSLPEIGWAYLMVAMVGIGSLAGVLALVVFNMGIIAKLTSETIDGIDRGPVEAADAAGASTMQRIATAVLPQIWPGYFSYVLYVFEINLRASAIIGMVGAGGIGQALNVERARFNYDNVSAIVVGFIVIVIVLDIVSQTLRRRLM
ncbi:phosphonate ABC transporter, permease protein PhnE [Microbacterium sp. Marseille-Q6965]|uniref:phosphonate ABC transporter, permease protein PhnE n=1 Tax=Microbacterium sp. Marseille-Q6965 TaxID=2965072 RepID=UPI0021B829B2|nr:phosphonate ABC transporter, permease protein PhnE [Microbacterium sp. Marseille-Q6965]